MNVPAFPTFPQFYCWAQHRIAWSAIANPVKPQMRSKALYRLLWGQLTISARSSKKKKYTKSSSTRVTICTDDIDTSTEIMTVMRIHHSSCRTTKKSFTWQQMASWQVRLGISLTWQQMISWQGLMETWTRRINTSPISETYVFFGDLYYFTSSKGIIPSVISARAERGTNHDAMNSAKMPLVRT